MKHGTENQGLDPLMRIAEVQAVVSYSSSQIYRMIKAGSFPAAVRLGPGRIAWRQSAIQTWLNTRQI